MCAIIDTNVVNQLWESGGTPAGQALREKIDDGSIPMVVGGQLSRELSEAGERMRRWLTQLQQAGRLTTVDCDEVDRVARGLKASPKTTVLASDDEHIVALATVSGARLLFTNDASLSDDFTNPKIVSSPRGKVYTTRLSGNLKKTHRDLLRRTDLCRRRS